jgi:hypothetical protein
MRTADRTELCKLGVALKPVYTVPDDMLDDLPVDAVHHSAEGQGRKAPALQGKVLDRESMISFMIGKKEEQLMNSTVAVLLTFGTSNLALLQAPHISGHTMLVILLAPILAIVVVIAWLRNR